MNRLFANLLYTLLVVFLITSCANIGTISGGDKDSIPPQMIVSKPVFLDTSFSDDQIVLYFNEYFELKDINQEFVSSPPFEETPDFKIKKRSLHVKFKEPLQDSVTYNLNFGNAIADYNEGNILENYRFVFSTKSEIDSFSISGNLKNAFDLKVPEKSMVMIFEKNEDSIPYKVLPNYQAKIDTSGNFSIEFIKPGTYKIFAYNDINTNKRVDDFESRAFLDSMIIPLREPFTKVDSVKAGTILHDINDPLLSDSLENDTVIIKNTFKNRPANLQLYMFDEQKLKQRIVDFAREERGKLKIVLELPAGPDFQIKPLNFSLDASNNIIEKNLTNDTITWWINDTIAMAMDSMEVNFLYTTRDSLGDPIPANDTILFEYREKKDKDAWKKKNKEENKVTEIEYLKLTYLTKDNKVDLNKKLRIESPTPFFEIDTSKIRLFEIYDTISIDTKEQKIVKAFRLQKDYLSFRFKRPIITDFKLYPFNFNVENWYSASSADSNRVWNCKITDAGVASMDTIKLLVDYDNRFFFDQVQLLTDTAILPMSPQKILTRKREEAEKIVLVFDKPLSSNLIVLPNDFTANGNWYRVDKNKSQDTITINLLDKNVSNKDTLTFSVKCFDYFAINGDSIYFNETMRVTYSERKQFLVSANRQKREELVLVFNKKLDQDPEIKLLDFNLNTQWYQIKKNEGADTLSYLLTDEMIIKTDTLNLVLAYKDTDRKGKTTNFSDTLQLLVRRKKDYNPRTPDTKSTSVPTKPETVHVYLPRTYELLSDSLNIRQRLFNSDWAENTKYMLRLNQKAFIDFYKVYNKAEDYEFSTPEKDYYSTVLLSLKNIRADQAEELSNDSLALDSIPTEETIVDSVPNEKFEIPRAEIDSVLGSGHLILQLLGKEEVVVKQYQITEDQEIEMGYLHPGDYQLRIIFDRNNNGKWDTGDYFKHIQPERVIMNGKVLQLKSKFENKLEWDVGKSLKKSFTKN